ncbi:hypothetical protein QTP70_029547 [Hemibagrus guttatus]|uniref:Podoplanin n=1 Tax=Hemibagrus guttatus TaxID=175788 RepID=A0AAE0V8F6_9TELE|nr:hypothetical protein QTP70_029547 [Hemibagrus guttatus]
MKFELLLLFALAGSFCTITHASTLVVPTAKELEQVAGDTVPTEATDRISEGEDAVDAAVTEAPAAEPAPAATEVAVKETEAPLVHSEVPEKGTEVPVNTEEPVIETETSVNNEAPEEHTEVPLAAHTESPAEMPETTVGLTETTAENTVAEETVATEGTPKIEPETTDNAETSQTVLMGPELKVGADPVTDDVEVEDSEGMSKGQVVGIVFGALVAVVVIIAVIVVVVRRMGQYSP